MAFGFDAGIILGARPADPIGQARSMADLLQSQQAMQINRVKLADTLQQQEQQRRLSDIYRQHGANPAAVAPALTGAGFGEQALDWTQRQSEAAARAAASQKAYQENIRQSAEFLARPFRGVKDQAGLDAAFQALERAGLPAQGLAALPRQYNAQTAPFYERLASLGMSVEDTERLAAQEEERRARRGDRQLWAETLAAQRGAALTEKREVAQGDDTRDLRKEISSRKEVAKYRMASAELASLKALAQESSGASDMALVFAFMKAMDPESVVRESEYASAAATGTPDQRMMGLVSKYWTGGPLSSGQRKAFIKAAEAAQSGHKAAYETAVKTYKHIAKKRGFDLAELGLDGDKAESGGPHGATVTQDGVTYTWNAETGEYE